MIEVPLSQLRANLPKFKRQAQLQNKRFAATYYGETVGFLAPLGDAIKLEKSGLILKSEEMSLKNFRAGLTECWERLQVDVDCIFLTYHSRRVATFLSTRLPVKNKEEL